MPRVFLLWLTSLRHYGLLCLFRSHPAYIPRCPHCLALTGLAYCLLAFVLLSGSQTVNYLLTQLLIEIGLLALLAWVGLRLRGHLDRMEPTFSALLGVNMIITLISGLLIHLIEPGYFSGEMAQSEPGNLLVILILGMVIWNLSVISLILQRTMELKTFTASLVAIQYFLIYELLVFSLFPETV